MFNDILTSNKVIQVVDPVYITKNLQRSEEQLESLYKACYEDAAKQKNTSIAFGPM